VAPKRVPDVGHFLDPYEARRELLLAVWLAAELTMQRETPSDAPPARPPDPSRGVPTPRSIRRRGPVRPPRAC
jgi:hypothetical protein